MAELHQTLGPLNGQLGQLGVVVGRTVKGRRDDLTTDGALEVGDLLGTLVDQHHHEVNLRIVLGDRVRDRLHDHRLASLRRRDDEATLSLADRADQVDDAAGHVLGIILEAQTFLRVQRGELGELGTLLHLLRIRAVDLLDLDQGCELLTPLPLAVCTHLTDNDVALAQPMATDHGHRDIGIVRARQVSRGAHESVLVTNVENAGARHEDVILAEIRLGIGVTLVGTLATILSIALTAAA